MDWDFFFGFAGRINRSKYWRVILLSFVCLMIFMMVVPLSIGSSFYSADPTWAMPLTLALLAGTMGPKGPNRFGSDPLAKGNASVNAFEARHA
jgi:uncharacterized membrane protein YhaH (DUF805 family)